MEIYGYRRNYSTTFLTWLAILASGFLLRLIFYWKPHWMLYTTFSRCRLDEAEKVLLIDKYNQYFVEQVRYLFGAPHPATLIHKGDFHQADEDEVLHSPEHQSAKEGAKSVTSTTYGSLVSNLRRQRTFSTRSNKSALTVTTDNEEPSDDEDAHQTANPSGDILRLELGLAEGEVNVSMMRDPKLHFVDYQNNERPLDDAKKLRDANHADDLDDRDHHHDHSSSGYKVRFFENKKIRYIWDEEEANFMRLRGFDRNVTFGTLQKMTKGLDANEQWKRRQLFGDNEINVEVQPYLRILFEEVLGPFYIFQVFSCAIWFNDDYYYYGTCIIIMSLMSLASSVIQIRRNQKQLRETVESTDYVKVCRGNEVHEVDSSELVPGDIVVVPTFNSTLQFDAILINGNVIVNESMLTGESVPVTKTPLPLQNYAKKRHHEVYYDEKEHSKHTLFCGTKVMQTRYYGGANVKALVIRVGFQTAKGELIRSIMFPKPVDFRFNRQIHKFIGVLACLALLGFTYSAVLKTRRGDSLKAILIKSLDLITIVVPPALPAAMTIGIIYAQSRLKKNKIFCISPRSINISGCINCVCFDKTGTLTEDSLSFNEVVPRVESKGCFGLPFDEDVMQTNSKQVERDHNLLLENGDYSPLMICLASCHSLTIIEQRLIGDPLDLQMFEATGWVLEEPDVDDENKFDLLAPTVVRPPRRKRQTPPEQEMYRLSGEFPSDSSTEDELDVVSVNANPRCRQDVGILRQFPFSSSLQRMSVITRQFGGSQYVVYSKGAPEKIASLCDPSTIPADFSEVLHGYTRKGFRVLALAYRPLKAGLSYTRMQRATRQDIEKDLRFLGLLTLGNLLKPETISVIDTLNKANIRSVMVTGDNMLTAISVANESGMLPEHDKTILLQVEKQHRHDKSPSAEESPSSQRKDTETAPMGAHGSPAGSQTAELPDTLNSPKSNHNNNIIRNNNMTQLERPLVLAIESIQLETRANESEPILSPKRASKETLKPKLVWHYINANQPLQAPNSQNKPQQGATKKESSAMSVPPADSVRIKMFGGGAADNHHQTRIHLALTGETWDVILRHYPEMLNAVCVRGTVFARMAPHQKQQLVEHLQSLEYFVGMCGDGANDSGALRSAHAGISLSDTEASVAAPFTSANANIACVPILISEGRAALVTAFGILKYMALYSLVQFCSVLLLYTMFTNFTDTQFLYEDLFIIATLVALFGRTEPYPHLDSKAPPSSLLSITQLASVTIQLGLMIFFQVLSLVILWNNDWYKPQVPQVHADSSANSTTPSIQLVSESVEEGEALAGHDNFAIFAISSFQLITLAIIFSKGKPYRKSMLSNYLLTAALLLITLLTVIVLLVRAEWNIPYISMDVLDVPMDFRLVMLCLAFIHFLTAFLGERFVVDHLIFRKSAKYLELIGMGPRPAMFEVIDKNCMTTHWLSATTKESC